MKMYTLNLAIPTGTRSVVINTPIACESLGVVNYKDIFAEYDSVQRGSLYENLITSLAHLYHSANVINNDIVTRLQSIVESIKETDAIIQLEHNWKTMFASSDDALELEFSITEIDELGVPVDAAEPNGYLFATLEDDGKHYLPVAMQIKKFMSKDDRSELYADLFALLNTYVTELDNLTPWTNQLTRIFEREEFPLVASELWNRTLSSGGMKLNLRHIPEKGLVEHCTPLKVAGIYVADGLVSEFHKLEDLGDVEL